MTARLLTTEGEPPRPNRAQINEHLYALFAPEFAKDYPDAWIEIAFADMDGDGTPNAAAHFSPFELEQAAAFAEKKNIAGCNVYVGPALRQGVTGPSGRSTADNFLASAYAWADSDDAEGFDRMNGALEAQALPTSLSVMTGRTPHRRAHLYFRFDGKATRDQVKNANVALKKLLGTDDVEDVCRVMRLAGTVSYPTEKKRARGYVTELVTLHTRKNVPCYTAERLTGFAAQGQTDSTRPGRTDDEIMTLLEASRIKGKWHNSVRDAIATMIGRGWSDLQIRLACAPYCRGGTNDPDLDDLINRARAKWNKPEDESENPAELEILRLAKLPAIKYETERIDAAKALGFRASMLDRLVEAERGDSKAKDPAPALYAHWNGEMAAEPVDGGILLRALKEAIRRYVFASDDQALGVALWIVFSWLHEHATHSPILFVTSAERDSGKTTLLGIINFLARRSLLCVEISGAALFRSITKWQPTLIVDEADDVLADNADLRSVINSGWTRGQGTMRCHPDTHEPELFSTFAPKVVAMKGRNLPDTTLSRSIIITMRPRRADDPQEHAADFDHLDNETFARLRSQAMRWVADNGEAIARATPEIPSGFHNRRRANWKPMLAIAEACGGDWKKEAWKAALAIEAVADTFDPSIGVELLWAIRGAFKAMDRITSADLIKDLVDDQTARWATWNKGKPVSQRQVANLLKPYGIKPRTIRLGDGSTPKGYLLEMFADAFDRFCTHTAGSTPRFYPPRRHRLVFTGEFDFFIRHTAVQCGG